MNGYSRCSAWIRTRCTVWGVTLAMLFRALMAWGEDGATSPQPQATHRVAIVLNGALTTQRPLLESFVRGMGEHGYINGDGLALDVRWANSQPDRLPRIISGALEQKPDVLVVAGPEAVRAAKAATATVPIVVASVSDSAGERLAASFAHTGGNVTGIAVPAEVLTAKTLKHLHELVPSAQRIAVLTNPANPLHLVAWKETESAARTLGVRLVRFEASGFGDLERALATMSKQRPQALVISADPLFNGFRRRIAKYAASERIPTGFFCREALSDGGLMSYSPSIAENYHRSASFVHRILQGAKPHELPVEQPVDFELVVNVRAARALGITVPQAMVASAEELVD